METYRRPSGPKAREEGRPLRIPGKEEVTVVQTPSGMACKRRQRETEAEYMPAALLQRRWGSA
jgi:hypothetical protein